MSLNLNEHMDIEDIKEAKRGCESEIKAILCMFEHQSGMIVRGVDIDRVQLCGMPSEIAMLTIDARLKE